MAKANIFCITTLLLLLAFSDVIARPERAFHDVTPMETLRRDNEVQKVGMNGDGCVGLGEDECMMRRPVEARLDYIYTNKHQPT